MITSVNVDQFSYLFTVKFRQELQMKLELKLHPLP